LGLLEDAPPLFGSATAIARAGVLLALPVLIASGRRTFSKCLRQESALDALVEYATVPDDPTREVRKLEGHYAYYGITGNGRGLNQVRTETQKQWYKWLQRRSREPGGMTWGWMNRKLKQTFVFPQARVVHSIYGAKA
jgi:hypothetical protein